MLFRDTLLSHVIEFREIEAESIESRGNQHNKQAEDGVLRSVNRTLSETWENTHEDVAAFRELMVHWGDVSPVCLAIVDYIAGIPLRPGILQGGSDCREGGRGSGGDG